MAIRSNDSLSNQDNSANCILTNWPLTLCCSRMIIWCHDISSTGRFCRVPFWLTGCWTNPSTKLGQKYRPWDWVISQQGLLLWHFIPLIMGTAKDRQLGQTAIDKMALLLQQVDQMKWHQVKSCRVLWCQDVIFPQCFHRNVDGGFYQIGPHIPIVRYKTP